ncbi:MAG TPA: hydrogenase maturation nickel metallochaperone HypA [Candidatus Omnitrophota bacterium]|nr:hydrogenase maturation nickel metallochaperone HypA [Candidatus Omnitrophota bacterium]
MHEMHILGDLVSDLKRLAAENRAERVTKVSLAMGEFTEINEEILRHYFKEHGKGTVLENAELCIEKSPTRELRLLSFDCE